MHHKAHLTYQARIPDGGTSSKFENIWNSLLLFVIAGFNRVERLKSNATYLKAL